jgi:hypothetical protein
MTAETRESITCPNCGFKVERVSRNGNGEIDIDQKTYSTTCRRAKDLQQFERCPELQGAIDRAR